jgi:molybdenum cofactor cytidylyltransferase
VKFGLFRVEDAQDCVLAHSLRRDGLSLAKGARLTGEILDALKAAGVEEVMAARLEDGDVEENAAAAQVAQMIAGAHLRRTAPVTGRCNLIAEAAGVLCVEPARIDALNAIDESLTAATLSPWSRVAAGDLVATVKIIPFAVPQHLLTRARALVEAPALRVAPFALRRVGVVSTLLPGLKKSVVAKTLRQLAARLEPAGAQIVAALEAPHDVAPLAQAMRQAARDCDILIVFGASATVDRLDTVPAALAAAGGRIEHFGMPVDPGNLLLLGACGDTPVIGAPGCARSIARNGFDLVLERLLAGLQVTRVDIARMGVGGLLGEIASRPSPRLRDA